MKVFILVRYTLQELSSKVALYLLLGISTLILVFLLLGLSSQTVADGVVLTLFGNPVTPSMGVADHAQLVTRLQASLAGGLLFGIVLFGVIATAGIVPAMLERGTIDIYLSKPLARWELLLGKSLGAVVIVLINIVYFLGAIWLLSGLKLGVWNIQLIVAAFSMTFAFACLYSIVLLLGVISQGSALPILGSFLYLFLIGGLLQGRQQVLYLISGNAVYRAVLDGLYYLLPQLSALKENIAGQIMNNPPDWKPFVQSLLSAALLFLGSATLFSRKDF